jgi:glutaredoxin
MKKLIYRPSEDKYYLSDELSDPKGKTHILKYKASPQEMPHTHFRDYVVVYGRLTCPYCQKTFNLLEQKKRKYIFVEVDSEPSTIFVKDALLGILGTEIKGQTTVPIVFDKGKFIGGANDSMEYFK